MAYFPFFMDIKEKTCLIIGGGQVALRKARTLKAYEALVTVVSREICPEIREILPPDRCLEKNLDPDTLKSLFEGGAEGEPVLVVAATSSREINHQTAEICRERGIPVNVIDMPSECSFIFPAVVRRGPVSIGINSGTESPALSKKIRQEVERAVPDHYGQIAVWLGSLREYVKEQYPLEADRRRILGAAASEAFRLERPLTEKEVEELVRDIG